jgi:hypothetical protein
MRATTILIAIGLLAMSMPAHADLGRPDSDTYKCTVTAGGGATPMPVPNVGVDSDQSPFPLPPQADAAVGGCQANANLPDTGIVTAIDAADGCGAYADVNPDLPGAEAPLEEGQPAKEGTAIWFYCEAGVVDASNAITIDFGA